MKILLKNKGIPDSQSLEIYSGRGGYAALRKALSLSPEEIKIGRAHV